MASSGCPWSSVSASASSLKSAAAAVAAGAGGDVLAQSGAADAASSSQVSVSAPEAELLLGERRTPPPEVVSSATGCPRWLLVLHRRWLQIDESWSSRLGVGLAFEIFCFVLVCLAKNHTKISTTVFCLFVCSVIQVLPFQRFVIAGCICLACFLLH